jgi:hypothetical protein
MALLPKLEAKTVDQFNYFEARSQFATSPFLEESIETYTLTWSLKRAFDLAAVDLTFEAGARKLVYIPLMVERALGDVAWQRTVLSSDSACQVSGKAEVFPGVSIDAGRLIGYPSSSGVCEFALRVVDELGRSSPAQVCRLAIP